MFSNGELMFNDVELTFSNVELIFNDAEHNLSVGKQGKRIKLFTF